MLPSNEQLPDLDLLPQLAGRYIKDVDEVVGQASSIEEIVEALSKRGCLNLTPDVDFNRCSEFPIAGGGYCDIFRGALHSGNLVAIKSLRVFDKPGSESNRKKLLKHAARELYHWSKLRHPNVLPLMGLALFRGHIAMISEWVEHGNLAEFLNKNPDADRIALCIEISDGLSYIHESDMVHGDLKGANIMISSAGTAMIADFGNAHLKELTLKFTNTTAPGLSLRWAAPELFSEEEAKPSKQSDVYAYGMTALETLTGKPPFEGRSERWLLASLTKGCLCPTRPESGISDRLWWILTSCWAQDPASRPPISTVKKRLCSTKHLTRETRPDYDCETNEKARMVRTGELGHLRTGNSRREFGKIPPSAPGLPNQPDPTPQIPDQEVLSPTTLSAAHMPRSTYTSLWAVSPHVLLVDDDAAGMRSSKRWMQEFGCIVDVVDNGVGAVDKVSIERYDVAFMGVVLPKMDGIGATSIIRRFEDQMPIIAMTNLLKPNNIKEYFSCGMNDILPKPFTPEELYGILEKHLTHLKQANQLKPEQSPPGVSTSPVSGIHALDQHHETDVTPSNPTYGGVAPNWIFSSEFLTAKGDGGPVKGPFAGPSLDKDSHYTIIDGTADDWETASGRPVGRKMSMGGQKRAIEAYGEDRGTKRSRIKDITTT